MKCHHCRKKIKGIEFDCKCNNNKFCVKCRYPETHNCDFNYKTHQKNKLQKELIKVVPEKIVRIN